MLKLFIIILWKIYNFAHCRSLTGGTEGDIIPGEESNSSSQSRPRITFSKGFRVT